MEASGLKEASSLDSVGSTNSTRTGGGLKITPMNLNGEDKLAIEFNNHKPKQNRVYPSQIALADSLRPGQMDASESYSQQIKDQLQRDKRNRGIQHDRKTHRHQQRKAAAEIQALREQLEATKLVGSASPDSSMMFAMTHSGELSRPGSARKSGGTPGTSFSDRMNTVGSLGSVKEDPASSFFDTHFPEGPQPLSASPKSLAATFDAKPIKPDPDAAARYPAARRGSEAKRRGSMRQSPPRDTRPKPSSKRSVDEGPQTMASLEYLQNSGPRPRTMPKDDSSYQYGGVDQPPSPPYDGGMSRDRKYATSQGIAGRQDPPRAAYGQRSQQAPFQPSFPQRGPSGVDGRPVVPPDYMRNFPGPDSRGIPVPPSQLQSAFPTNVRRPSLPATMAFSTNPSGAPMAPYPGHGGRGNEYGAPPPQGHYQSGFDPYANPPRGGGGWGPPPNR